MPAPDKSKPVLITGCSTGIGRETAEAARRQGLERLRDGPQARRDRGPEGRRAARPSALDVTDEKSMASAVAAVEETDGPIGSLVNNAGYSQSGAVETIPMDSLRRQFETNVFGLVRMCQLVLPGMREAGEGRIVNISSMGGKLVFPGGGAYHATKFSVEALSDALRFEVKGFGVGVVIIEPGLITTEFGETAHASIGENEETGPYAKFNRMVGKVTPEVYKGPMSRFGGGPEKVADKIEKAISSSRPRTRYKVTISAGATMGMRKAMTDKMWDRAMAQQYKRPGPES